MSSGTSGVSATGNDSQRHRSARGYRDVLLLIAIGVALWGVWVAQNATSTAARASHQTVQEVARVQEGRSTSITITCAVLSALSQAGEKLIKGPAQVETPFSRFLEEHGYPSAAVRSRRSEMAARGYVADIDQRVSRELARLGKRLPPELIRPDGAVDCVVLQQVSVLPRLR